MALPAGLATVTVTAGPYTRPDGTPAAGRVRFVPEARMLHLPSGSVVLADAVIATLDAGGATTATLPASDASGLVASVAYWVYWELSGVAAPEPRRVMLAAAQPTVDLDLTAPVTSSPPSYTTVASVAGLSGTITADALRAALGLAAVATSGSARDLTATGTKDGTTVLHGDNTWKVPAGGAAVSDATATTKGVVQLAGDLGGTAAAPTVPGLAGKANAAHTHPATDLSDSTAIGRAVVTAADAAAARTAIGAGTSNLVLGTTATTAKAGDYAPPNASTTAPGLVQLAGDLGGTATAPTVGTAAANSNTAVRRDADAISSFWRVRLSDTLPRDPGDATRKDYVDGADGERPHNARWRVGFFYAPISRRISATVIQRRAVVTPWFLPAAVNFDRWSVEVTGTGQAGATFQPAVYLDDNGYPGALHWSGASIDISTTGVKDNVVTGSLPRGWLWVGGLCLGPTQPSMRQHDTGLIQNPGLASSSSAVVLGNTVQTVQGPSDVSALPNPYPSSYGQVAGWYAPVVAFRAA